MLNLGRVNFANVVLSEFRKRAERYEKEARDEREYARTSGEVSMGAAYSVWHAEEQSQSIRARISKMESLLISAKKD